MTLSELYKEGKEQLLASHIREWELDAWYLLEHVSGCTRNEYYLRPEREIKEDTVCRYRELIRKRSLHIPLQYLTGTQEFMGFSFKVNEYVLIPRQDTEILVEEAVKYIGPGMKILDMCTGSGCILLSILKLVRGVDGTGVDVSKEALQVAEENRKRLDVQAAFVQSNLFEHVRGEFDCVLSNPPYIPSGVVDLLMEEVRDYEPGLALDGGEDGLYYYRLILQQTLKYLKAGGMIFLEIGYDQAEAVMTLMEKDYFNIRVVKDLSGLDRVVCGCLKAENMEEKDV